MNLRLIIGPQDTAVTEVLMDQTPDTGYLISAGRPAGGGYHVSGIRYSVFGIGYQVLVSGIRYWNPVLESLLASIFDSREKLNRLFLLVVKGPGQP